jgi:hypothetical protein
MICGWHILLDRVGTQHLVGRIGQELCPPDEVLGGTRKASGARHRRDVEDRFADRDVTVRGHVVAGHRGAGEAEGCTPHPQRVEDPGLQAVVPLPSVEPGDNLPEHGEGEVGVVPTEVRLEDPLGVVPAGHELGSIRVGERLPDVADGLTLHPRHMAEHLPDRHRGVLALGYVLVDGVVEAEPPLVAQRHHHHRGEGLADRRDEELRVGGRCGTGGGHIGAAETALPEHLTVTCHRGEQSRHPGLALPLGDDAVHGSRRRPAQLGHPDTIPGQP